MSIPENHYTLACVGAQPHRAGPPTHLSHPCESESSVGYGDRVVFIIGAPGPDVHQACANLLEFDEPQLLQQAEVGQQQFHVPLACLELDQIGNL